MSSVLIYILCYNDYTQLIAEEKYKFDWIRIIRLPNENNPYLENIMYNKLFEEYEKEWENFDYVGAVSWKAYQKLYNIDFKSIVEKNQGVDVISFWGTHTFDLLDQAKRCHPEFNNIWFPVLKNLGFEVNDITSNEIPCFYGNYWVAKKNWLRKYIEFSKILKKELDTLESIQKYLWSNPDYQVHVEKTRLMKLFGKPHFTYHPFILERMPCFYFWYNKASIYVPNNLYDKSWD